MTAAGDPTICLEGRVFTAPYTADLRALTPAEKAGLKASIKNHGVTSPIIIDEHDAIIDGYHRACIAQELEGEPRAEGDQERPPLVVPFQTLIGHTPDAQRALALSLNKNRRHLTEEEKRTEVRRHLLEHPEHSNNWIGEDEGVSKNTVEDVRAELVATCQIDKLDHLQGRDGKFRPAKHTLAFTGSAAEAQQVNALLRGMEDIPDGVVSGTDIHKQARAEERERQHCQYQLLVQEPPVVPEGARARYRTIVVDPPWEVVKIDRDVRPHQAGLDYATLSVQAIKDYPVPDLMAEDWCHCYLWTTERYLHEAFHVLEAWGLTYVFALVWAKAGGFQPTGLPQYNGEFVLFGHRGPLAFLDTKDFPVVFAGRRREHSRKPEEFYDLVARVSPGPRIDVFSREARAGWDQMGAEVDRFTSTPADGALVGAQR